MRCLRVDFGRLRALQPAHIPCELNHRKLHAVTEPKIGDVILAAEPDRGDLPFNTARAESAWHDHARVGTQAAGFLRVLFVLLRVDPRSEERRVGKEGRSRW